MAGRNSKPTNQGPLGKPGRLDQYGSKLASRNDAEFAAAAGQACDDGEANDSSQSRK
ncbi:MAG: hypothetical protein J7639_12890 [Paenibacillaceae bacterium]|nr:hypothetical protein [Paenibacillaceae bacterium]